MSHPRPRGIRNNYPSKLVTTEIRAVDERVNGVCRVFVECENELRFMKPGFWLNIN